MKIKEYNQMKEELIKDDRGDSTGAFINFVREQRALDQEPRNMYAGGQLVQNTVDGSRPGYAENVKKQKVGKYTLERTGPAGTLKMRNIPVDPLTSYEKIKIKKQFPKVKKWDFKTYPYGVPSKDIKNYDGIRHFIARGFVGTTKFKVLPVSVQTEIKGQFPEVKKWDFKKYAYGVSPERIGERERRLKGLPPKDNRALVRKIARFIDEPEDFRYKFRVGNADGFMLYSMDRAYLQGNENYKPIKRGGKVVGFIDYTKDGGGKKYYYNGYIVNNKLKAGEKIIKDHPHFNNIKKFHNVALKSKLSLDDTSNVFKQMFPKGFDTSKVKFNDLVQFVSNKASKRNIYNAIVKHHTLGVGTNPTKDLQILTSVFNKQADDIGALIKKGDFSRVLELKEKGIRIVVDGKAYGAPKETAEAGYQRIVSDVTKDVKTWKKTDFNKFKTYLKQLCPRGGSASGGRIGFKLGGAATLECGIAQFNKNLKTGNANSVLMRRILANGGNILKGSTQMLNPKELLRLRNLIGPTALGFIAAWEAGEITTDHLRKGIPWNEAFAKNWLTKSFLPYSEEFAKQKNLLQSGKLNESQRIYALDMMKAEKTWKEMDRIDGMERDQLVKGTMDDDFIFNSQEKIDAAKTNVNRILEDLDSRDSFRNTGKQMENIREMDEKAATELAGDDWKPIRHILPDSWLETWGIGKGFEDSFEPKVTRGDQIARAGKNAIVGHKVDYSRPTYDKAITTPLDADQLQAYAEYHRDIGELEPREELPPAYIDYLQKREKWRQLFEKNPSGLLGTQYNADGGRAGYTNGGLTRTVAPDSGPMSQGLRSLYINDKDY